MIINIILHCSFKQVFFSQSLLFTVIFKHLIYFGVNSQRYSIDFRIIIFTGTLYRLFSWHYITSKFNTVLT